MSYLKPVNDCSVLCVLHCRVEEASDDENDDDSDSEIIEKLQAEKDKESKKSGFIWFYYRMNN